MKPTDKLNSNFIGITNLYVSGSLSAHHQEFLAVNRHWYILQIWWPFAARSCSWQQTVVKFAKCTIYIYIYIYVVDVLV